jgi:atypical dual specificity phosphatase
MWKWTLNWSEIRGDLVIGSCPMNTKDIDKIRKKTGATSLLSVQTNECRGAFGIDYQAHQQHAKRSGVALLNAPMRDFDPPDQRRRLPAAIACLHNLLKAEHKVYVHCTAGINRAPLTVLGYLTFVEAMPVDSAFGLIQRGRGEAEPYWEAFHGCREDLVERYRDDIEYRAFEISQRNPDNDDAQNWKRAEIEVIRAAFLGPLSAPFRRLDPNRS